MVGGLRPPPPLLTRAASRERGAPEGVLGTKDLEAK